jgi:hypothetical protein
VSDTVEHAPDNARWWGGFDLEPGQVKRWEIGPTILWIGRFEREWRVAHKQIDDPISERLAIGVPDAIDGIEEGAAEFRFGFRSAGHRVRIEPLLADRAVVIRPEVPFRVVSGEEVTLYVSTPVWLRIAVGDKGPKMLDLPSYRPSDTWFGASTIDGELCYASRTTGRLELADVQMRPHRVVTPVRLVNRAQDALELDRLKLPVGYFDLYDGPSTLWTQSVTLTREESGDLAGLRFEPTAPREAQAAPKVAGARQASDQNLVVRAFSKIFRSE